MAMSSSARSSYERTRRSAWIGLAAERMNVTRSGVATLLGKRSSRVDASRVNAMARLDHPASDDGYCERIHGRGA